MLTEYFIDDVLRLQLHEGVVTFANNSIANNHLDLGYDEVAEQLRPELLRALGNTLINNELEQASIVPVPTGAEGWAYNLGLKNENVDIIPLRKLAKRTFELRDKRSVLEKAASGVVVLDDATTDGGTSEAAADYMSQEGFKIAAVISLFIRGKQLAASKYPRLWLAHKYVPTNLDWKKFREEGKIVELTP
jgi:orotate phosphoribosyltransferase